MEVREGLNKNLTFEQRYEGSEGRDHSDISRKCSKHQKQQVQRSWGESRPGMFKEQQEASVATMKRVHAWAYQRERGGIRR